MAHRLACHLLGVFRRLVELDPLHEEAHADLIRVLARSGQHRLAVQNVTAERGRLKCAR